MAITETRVETGTDLAVASPLVPAPVSILGSGDHTVVGLVYMVASILFGVAGLVGWALTGIDDIYGSFLSDSVAEQVFQTSLLGLVLLVVVPLFLGIGTYVVPLQVGARTIAFPRAAAAGLWTWLLSSGLFLVAVSIDGGFGGGRAEAVSLGLLAVLGLVAALLLGTVCVLSTAIGLRAPGMTLDRVPMTTFAMLVGGSVWVLTLPILAADVLLMWVDLRYGDGSIGESRGQFAQVAWMVQQPQIYAFVVPGLGIAADVVATFTGARLAHRGVFLTGIGAFAVLGIGAWAQPALFPDASEQLVWQVIAVLQVVPALVLLGGLATALRTGRPALRGALGLALVSMLLLLVAVVAGALLAITPLGLRGSGWAEFGQFILVIAAGLTMSAAGLAYWSPKMTGRIPSDATAKLGAPVMLLGGVLAGVSFVAVGFESKFSGLGDAVDAFVWASVFGAAILILGLLLALLGLLSASRHSAAEAGADPWGAGQTLEWKYPSPPGNHDLGDLPVVHSPEPLLDEEA